MFLNIGYLFFLALFGLKVKSYPETDKLYKFNILIPAHNEEHCIAGTLKSILDADYPAENIKLTVIADHCTDATVDVVAEQGVDVVDRQSNTPGKSSALAEMINRIGDDLEDDEAILIFDADNIIDRDFFREINKCLASGADIAQGNTGIYNRMETVFTRLNYVNFAVTNRFKELARSQAGLTCRLRGHGMAFKKQAVDRLSWQANSMVEDQELTLEVVMNDYRVQWVHQAHVDSIIPPTAAEAAVQRKRWAGGKSLGTKHAVGQLFRKFLDGRDWVAFDLMVDYLMASYSIQLALVIIGVIIALIASGVDGFLFKGFFAIGLAYFGYYLIASLLEKVPMSAFGSFFLSPFFIFWRVWIFISSMRGIKAWR